MFSLDDKISAVSDEVVRWPLCRVLLMRDKTYPWLMLVPAREGARDLHSLSKQDQLLAMGEITRASKVLEQLFSAYKINVAALGNVVDQLHIHIIARSLDDPAWPAPVWNHAPAVDYTDRERQEMIETLRQAFSD